MLSAFRIYTFRLMTSTALFLLRIATGFLACLAGAACFVVPSFGALFLFALLGGFCALAAYLDDRHQTPSLGETDAGVLRTEDALDDALRLPHTPLRRSYDEIGVFRADGFTRPDEPPRPAARRRRPGGGARTSSPDETPAAPPRPG